MEPPGTGRPRTLVRLAGAVCAAAVVAAALAGPAHGAPGSGAVSLKVPLTGTIASAAGPLAVTGTAHLVVIPPNPVMPVDPVRVQTNLSQVRAANAQVSCKAVGAQKFTLASAGTGFTGSYRLYPGDPILPQDPVAPGTCAGLASLGVDYQLQLNDQGEVTGATAVALDTE
jgi:hypothetical protein